MNFGKQRLLELLSIQQEWVHCGDRWFHVKVQGDSVWCDGILIDDNWISEEKEVFEPINNRWEILDL